MYQNLSEKLSEKLTLKRIVLVFSEIIFLIIVVAIINSMHTNPLPAIEVKDMPSEIRSNERQTIPYMLAAKVISNTDNMAVIDKHIATARQGTFNYEYDKEYDIYSGNFVIDLATLRQSYYVTVSWSDTFEFSDESIEISCIPYEKKDLIIYEDFNCNASKTIGEVLPAEISLEGDLLERVRNNYPVPDIDPSFVTIRLDKTDVYSNRNKALEYQVVACGDEDIISESLTIVRDWITSSGFDPNDYKINFVDGCEDG